MIRVDLGGDRHAWVFSEDTVRAIDRLYEEYGPPFGEHLPEFLITRQLLTLELWQWLGLILIFLGSAVLSFLIARLALAIGRKASQLTSLKTHFKWGEILGTSAKGPLRLFLWAVSFVAATRLLLLPPKVQWSIDVLGKSLSIITAAWFLLRVLGRAADRFQQLVGGGEPGDARARSARTQVAILRRVFAIAIYLITGALLLLQFEVVRHIGVSILASQSGLETSWWWRENSERSRRFALLTWWCRSGICVGWFFRSRIFSTGLFRTGAGGRSRLWVPPPWSWISQPTWMRFEPS